MSRDESILIDPTTGLPIGTTAGALDVNATFGGVILVTTPEVGPTGAAVPAQAAQVGGPDAAGLLRANRLYDLDSGGGTEFALGVSLRKTAGGGSVEAGTLADPLRVDPTGTTPQPVTVAALPLPAGAATEATLAAMSAKLPAALVGGRLDENVGAWMGSTAPTVGSKTMANSLPFVMASDQTQFPAALVGGRLDVNAGAWLGSTAPTVGSKTSANSVPVVIASDQDFTAAGGGALPTRNVAVGGTDGAVFRGIRLFDLDTGAGAQHAQGVNLRLSANGGSVEAQGQKLAATSIPVVLSADLSYSAAITGLVPNAAATDIFTITGSGTKTVYITYLEVSATATAGANTDVQLRKLSTALTGGTSAAVAAVPNDSNNAAATATVLSWTVNPAGGGTLVGIVRTTKLAVQAPATVTGAPAYAWKLGGPTQAQPIVLRGTGQVLAVNLNGATLAGNSFNIAAEWFEV